MNDCSYNFWHYGSRYREIPIPFFGIIFSVCFFAFAYYLMIGIKDVLENDKQNILW